MSLNTSTKATLLGVAVSIGLAGTAHAASYAEVVSRANGVAGDQPAIPGALIGAVSSDGRYAAYSGNPSIKEPEWDGVNVQPPDYYLYVRDIVSNATYQVTTNRFAFAGGFDDAGRYLTYTLFDGTSISAGSQLRVVDTVKKATALVGRATGANGATAENAAGLVSGDGTSVVFTSTNVPGSGPGIYRRTLATNVTTRLGALPTGPLAYDDGTPLSPQPVRSISKSGAVITFDESVSGSAKSLVIAGTKRFEIDGSGAVVSADGSTIAYLTTGTTAAPIAERVVFRNVATGAETSYPAPAGSSGVYVDSDGIAHWTPADGAVTWLSADGKQAAVAPDHPFGFSFSTPPVPYQAQLFDRPTSSWSPAGPYASTMYSPAIGAVGLFNVSAVSRNGRYTLFSSPSGALEGDNYGAALPGGSDLPPANSYFAGPAQYCKGEVSTSVTSHLSPAFLPPVKSLTGTVSIDGKYGGQDTFTTDRTATIPLPTDAKTVTIKASVTFANGKTASGTYDYGVHNSPYC